MPNLLQMMRELKDSASNSVSNEGSDFSPRSRHHIQGINPKLGFPKLDGVNPRIWIKKCMRYCNLCKTPDEQRVDLASLYMVDKAETWVSSHLSARKHVDWDDFIIDLSARFQDTRSLNVVEQFNKLQQLDDLETYLDDFESLRSIMIQTSHVLPESYILDSFVGLKF